MRSFEADVAVAGLPGGPLRAIFIRAPWIAEHGPGVQILAEVDGHPVAASEANLLAVAFHSATTSRPGARSRSSTALVVTSAASG